MQIPQYNNKKCIKIQALIDVVIYYKHALPNRCGVKPTSVERLREEKIIRVLP